MMQISLDRWKELIRSGLEEDQWHWDWSTLGATAARGDTRAVAHIIAKARGVWAGEELVHAVGKIAAEHGQKNFSQSLFNDGAVLRKGERVATWTGSARVILALERTFLNLASYVSGIATATEELVRLVRKACPGRPPRITATRKTLPGFRDLAIHGVQVGGGFSHRLSLASGVLIKENHIAIAGGIEKALKSVREIAPHGLKMEAEVRSLDELREALCAGVDAVLLDNFSPGQVKSALKLLKGVTPGPCVEVSGGIHSENISEYAQEGVDVISVGSLTHSVQAVDLSLLMEGVGRRK